MSSFEGEGDREPRLREGAMAAEEDVLLKPGRISRPFAGLAEVSLNTPFTCPCRLGYRGLAACTECILSIE